MPLTDCAHSRTSCESDVAIQYAFYFEKPHWDFSKPIFHFRVSHPHLSLLWPKLLIKRHIGKWKQLHYDQLSLLNNSVAYNVYYCPQCSCHKVMFLHISVILFTEGKCLADTPPHPGRHPPGRHPLGRHPWTVYSIDQIYISVCGLEVNKEVVTALSPQLKADTPPGQTPPPEQTPP